MSFLNALVERALMPTMTPASFFLMSGLALFVCWSFTFIKNAPIIQIFFSVTLLYLLFPPVLDYALDFPFLLNPRYPQTTSDCQGKIHKYLDDTSLFNHLEVAVCIAKHDRINGKEARLSELRQKHGKKQNNSLEGRL